MLLNAMDLGVCGVEQLFQAGKVFFNTKGIDKGIELMELPENIIITKAVVVVNKAFNAETTNELTIGTGADFDDILGTAEVTAGTTGTYMKQLFKVCRGKTKVNVKYATTGKTATDGEADVYIGVVRIPG